MSDNQDPPARGDARHLPFDVRGRRAAAIDLGTQTALLLIVEQAEDGAMEVLEEHALSARLGEGLVGRGSLAPEAAERTLEILGHFLRRIEHHDVPSERRRAVGTAVLRRAPDGPQFATRAGQALGFELEIISGDEEARLGYRAACAGDVDGGPARALVDLGGGSVEVVLEGGQRRVSMPFGAVTGTEQFEGRGGLDALDAALGAELGAVERAAPGTQAIAIGGTASNLACLVQGLASFEPRLAEGAELDAAAVLEWARRLDALDIEARRDLPIEPDRAAILPAGALILGRVLERLGAGPATVTGRGLRHAVAAELLLRGA